MNTTMNTTLVIPDIHHKHKRAQAIIDSVEHDELVFTGDYFDSYGDTVQDAIDTAIWLKEKVLHNPKAVALIGNHDVSYIWNKNENIRCDGFSPEKNEAINKVLTSEDKAKFKFFHSSQGYWFSHAGVSNRIWAKLQLNYPDYSDLPKAEYFKRVLTLAVNDSVTDLDAGNQNFLFDIGWDRNGWQQYGGMIWVDWKSFSPISGINQIVGHTTNRVPSILIQKAGGGTTTRSMLQYYRDKLIGPEGESKRILSKTFNLDTGLNHYAIIRSGDVQIYDHINQINLRDVFNFAIPESSMNNLS